MFVDKSSTIHRDDAMDVFIACFEDEDYGGLLQTTSLRTFFYSQYCHYIYQLYITWLWVSSPTVLTPFHCQYSWVREKKNLPLSS
jgi:hypothetical protein